MPLEPTPESIDAKTTLLAFVNGIDARAREAGRRHELAGRVISVVASSPQTLVGKVETGGRIFTAELWRVGASWTSSCTCGHRGPESCEHAAAVALVWLERIRRGRESFRLHPLAPLVAPTRPAESATAGPTFRQQTERILGEKLGREVTAEEGAFLGRLASIFDHFRSRGSLNGQEVRQLGFETAESRRSHLEGRYHGWWREPPADPLALWQYLAYDIESSALTIPEFMRPLTDTAPIRAFLGRRVRRDAALRWEARFKDMGARAGAWLANAKAAAAETPVIELRLRVDSMRWAVESRLSSTAPWKAVPRSVMEGFMWDETGALAGLDSQPATFVLLTLCRNHWRRHDAFDLRPGAAHAGELLHRILSNRLSRSLVVNAAGGPIVFASNPLAWRLARSAQNDRDYELALYVDDNTPLPSSAIHLAGRPDFYLHDGIVYLGPPALDGSSATAAIVPAEVIEQPEVLEMLRRFGTRFPAEIESRFVSVPLRARFECGLAWDEAENEIMTLRLLAVTAGSTARSEWSGLSWENVSGERAPGAEEPTERIPLYDLSEPEWAAAQLADLKLSYDQALKRWTRRLTKNLPDEFVAWREALPASVEVRATGELASLLTAPVRATLIFELTATTVHRDWFDLALALKPEDSTLTPAEIALLLKARGRLVRLPGKGWRRLNVELEDASKIALQATGLDAATAAASAIAGERHRLHAVQLAHTAITDVLPIAQAKALRERMQAVAAPLAPVVPAGLRAELRAYQREGFEFLAFLSANRLGGVLADDMGLGKTLEALTWLLWLSERQPPGTPLRVLVVCPKSVVGNWQSETARFAPALGVVRFTPDLVHAAKKFPGDPGRPTLLVANYTQLRLSAGYFKSQPWDAVILDEGQFIKSPSSKVAHVARELPGEHRVVLTGTPIENRLLDLWSLFAFALPGLLGSQAAFKRQYADDDPVALARLRARVRHFLLRRTKAQVAADLPARTEEDVTVELEGVQAQLYHAELKRARAELLNLETARGLGPARFHVLASLMRLRQICCHPALIDEAHRAAPAAKLDDLLERLEELRDEGHQVLVFSQFVGMLEMIAERLTAAGINYLLLTGATENREALVARFQAERNQTVFLLSLKAAGFGLNLTAASYVFLYDPWWNPAVEAQAIDRTHRIGQVAPVNAYRLIARGTVEEKIRALQREKAALASAVVQEESLASVLDMESLRQILA